METISEYIQQFDVEKQAILNTMYQLIKDNIPPETTERMSWAMPTFYLNGNLVHFAMNKSHIGLYPGENGVKMFEDQLVDYKHSKGAIQFPLNKPLPTKLIIDIVKFRVKENLGS